MTQENVGKPFAIIVDNSVISAPNINEPILGGRAQISGSFTVESANQLAIALRSGKLPVALKVIEERTVGPDLGADSIRAGMLASIVAAVAVVVFMLRDLWPVRRLCEPRGGHQRAGHPGRAWRC